MVEIWVVLACIICFCVGFMIALGTIKFAFYLLSTANKKHDERLQAMRAELLEELDGIRHPKAKSTSDW